MNARPRLRAAVRWIAVVIAGLVLLELGARGFLWIRGHPYDASEVRSEVARVLRAERERAGAREARADRADTDEDMEGSPTQRYLHPYTAWETARGFGDLDEYSRSLGSEDGDTVEVLILGGSVAEDFGRADGAARLGEILRADPSFQGKKVRFLRFGREGYKAPQPVNLLVYLLDLGFEPEVVIHISGSEDLALGSDNAAAGAHPVFPANVHWSKLAVWGTSDRNALDATLAVRRTRRNLERWGGLMLDWGLARSALLGYSARRHFLDLRDELASQAKAREDYLANVSSRRSLRGPSSIGDPSQVLGESVRAWEEGSRCLHGICGGRGILYVHVLPPALHDQGSKKLTAQEIERGRAPASWVRGIGLGYPLLRRKGQELAARGIDFVDASLLFEDVTDDVYVDALDFGPAGQRMLAEKIGQAVLQRWPMKH